jgi:AcrR family transcriptional regulator
VPSAGRPLERKRHSPTGARSVAESASLNLRAPEELDGLASRLLLAGRRNFVKYGFHKASVANIAAEAGTSVGLVYYHFQSKEGLYRAIWADYQRRQWQHAHQAIVLVRSAGVNDGRALFLAGTRAYLANCWDYRDVVSMVVNGNVPPGFSAASRDATEEWVRMNTLLLKMPEDLSTQVLVDMASSAIGGASNLIAECKTREEADQVVELAMRIFSRMIVPSADEDVKSLVQASAAAS